MFRMIQKRKREDDLGANDHRLKQQTLSTLKSPSPSTSASTLYNSVPFVHLPRSIAPLSSSPTLTSNTALVRLPAKHTLLIGILPQDPRMPSQTSVDMLSLDRGLQLNRNVPEFARQETIFTAKALTQATTPVVMSAPSALYSATYRPLRQRLEPDGLQGLNGRIALQSEALEHFTIGVVASDLASDSATTLPAGWSDHATTMVDPPTKRQSVIASSSNFETSPYNATQANSSRPSDTAPEFPSSCLLCQDTPAVFNTENDYVVHLWEKHLKPSEWTESQCRWVGCPLEKTFASVNLWLAHVRTVHQKSFYCQLEGCQFRLGGPKQKAFGSQADLNRHGLSKTHVPPVFCDKPGCTGRDNLHRRDKKNKHNRDYHGSFLCPISHCPRSRHMEGVDYGFSTARDLATHQLDKHQNVGNAALDHGTITA